MWSDLMVRLVSVFRRAAMEREMDDEMRAHVEREVEKFIRAGLSRHDARRRALAAFGGLELVKEQTRDARGTGWIEEAFRDVCHAVRILGRQKRVTAALVLTMALGVGANSAVTGAIDEILWRPLTMPHAHRIVAVFGFDKASSRYQQISLPDIRDLERASSVQALAGYWRLPVRATFDAGLETLSGEVVTASYFRVFTAPFAAGRPFSAQDETSSTPVAVISERLWRERFGAADIIGRTIRLENRNVPIVGVASRHYRGDHNLNWYTPADVWIPASAVPELYGKRYEGYFRDRAMPIFNGLGLVAPHSTVAAAKAELAGLFASVRPATRAASNQILEVLPAAESKFYPGYRAEFARNLSAFGFMTVLILLLTAANVANLLLERTSRRQREIAVRTALGAGRGRLIRQLFVEGLVLAASGFVLSLLMVAGLQRVLTAFPDALGVELSMDLGITSRVLAYCAGVSLLVAAVVSLIPALRSGRGGIGPLLRHAVAGPDRAGRSWISQSLTVAQVCLSAILLVGSLVVARGLWVAHTVPLGFDPSTTVVLHVDRFVAESGEMAPWPSTMLDRNTWLPASVTDVALASDAPFSGFGPISVQDGASGARVPAYSHSVSGSFFDTLRIPILAGRAFENGDAATGATAIVSEGLARRFWGAESALGRVVRVGTKRLTIVGVAGDTRYNDVWDSTGWNVYQPLDKAWREAQAVVVRTADRPESSLPAIVRAWNGLAPTLPIEEAMTGAALKARALEPMRLGGVLIGAFTLVAITIAGVGLYSTTAWLVEQRSREIAVRIAIGGLPRRIGGRVMARSIAMTLTGSTVGFGIAAWVVPRLSGLTHGLASFDAWVMTVSTVLLAGVSIVAAVVPTRRAIRMDPLVILKSE